MRGTTPSEAGSYVALKAAPPLLSVGASEYLTARDRQSLWRDSPLPLVYRRGALSATLVRVPGNPQEWEKWAAAMIAVQQAGRQQNTHGGWGLPRWLPRYGAHRIPDSWTNVVIEQLLLLHGSVWLVQSWLRTTRCTASCWNAQGWLCTCLCGGAFHGRQQSRSQWVKVEPRFHWKRGQRSCSVVQLRLREGLQAREGLREHGQSASLYARANAVLHAQASLFEVPGRN